MIALTMLAAAGALTIGRGQGVSVQSSGRPDAVTYNAAADVLRFELRPGERWPGDNQYKIKERVEVATPMVPAGQTLRASFGLTVKPGRPNTAAWVVLAQVQRRDASGSFSGFPILGLELHGEALRLVMRYGDPKDPTYRELWRDRRQLRRGVLYKVQLELRCAPDDGYLAFWINDVERASIRGENPCFADTAATYFKTGIYRSAAPETLVTSVQGLVVVPTGQAGRPGYEAARRNLAR
jgi:hypothetical protein